MSVCRALTIALLTISCSGGEKAPAPSGSKGITLNPDSMSIAQPARVLFRRVYAADSVADPGFVTYFAVPMTGVRIRKSIGSPRTVRSFVIPDTLLLSYATGDQSRSRSITIPLDSTNVVADLLLLNADSTGTSWTGQLRDEPASSVVLRLESGHLDGTIKSAGIAYRLGSVRDSVHVLEMSRPQAAPPAEGLKPHFGPPPAQPRRREVPKGKFDEPYSDPNDAISVLALVTPKSLEVAGSTLAALIEDVRSAVTEANGFLKRSGVTNQFRLAETRPVRILTDYDVVEDVSILRNSSSPVISAVRKARDALRASVVMMIVSDGQEPKRNCGYTESANDPSAIGQTAYVVVPYRCMTDGFTFAVAHELGHAVGMGHDRSQPDERGIYEYSWGYRDSSGRFRDVMAYNCESKCDRVGYYSTGDSLYRGRPIGRKPGSKPAEGTDNALTARKSMPLIAHWR